jgi:hypothetical protein
MNSTEFSSTITKNSYPKYQFQLHQAGRKLGSKTNNRVQNSINDLTPPSEASKSLYKHHTYLKTSIKGYCAFCLKKKKKTL